MTEAEKTAWKAAKTTAKTGFDTSFSTKRTAAIDKRKDNAGKKLSSMKNSRVDFVKA